MSQLKSGQSCDIAFVAVALSVPRHSPPRASLHQTIPESLMLCSKDRHPWFGLRFQEGAAPLFSTHAMYRCLPGHTPFPAPARSILPPSLDHPASCIQNPASAFPMKLLLIDGHYYVYRSFFAIPNLSNSRGEPTNAIFGFTKTLRLMLKHLQPEFGAVVWDEGVPQKRVELQPAYKETRKEMPKPMIPQLEFIQKLTPLLGFRSISLPDTEADDLMGCYAIAACERPGVEVVLATNDKDLYQLVGPCVKVYTTAKADLASPKDPFALLGEDEVTAKWGVPPRLIGDVLALTGDSVDNIPGIGLGRKTAAALIREFGGLEPLLDNGGNVKSARTREKLANAREQVLQNRKMVDLDCGIELPVPIDQLRIEPDYPALIAALESCEFKSLLQEVRDEAKRAGTLTQDLLLP
ncbi:MAG: flap endonuclease [Verrucomicrobia bacterium]|nr:MAG: flap endonuclease [Verrucomicrobiota bacterium]